MQLNSSIVNVTGNWYLKENWSCQKAMLCSPDGLKPTLKFSCRSFFEDEPSFKKLMEDLKLPEADPGDGKAKTELGAVTSGSGSSSMHMNTPRACPRPRGSVKSTLSRNFARKVLAQLRKS